MNTFLFLPFHGIGHFNALFGVARALQKTHKVVFAGTGYFHTHVSSRNFEYRILASHPFGIGLEGWIHDVNRSRFPYWSNVIDRWKDTLYHERKTELTKLLAELKPDHVLVDAQQATDVVVLKTIDPKLRVSIFSVPPPYLLIPGLPPVNSAALPGDSDEAYQQSMKAIREKVWFQKMKYFGMGDRAIVDRRLRRNKMGHLKDAHPSLITLAVKDVDHYVLTYKEFDFHHPHLDNFHYVGPHPDDNRVFEVNPKRLIYCSFGTVPSTRDTASFLKKLNEAIKGSGYDLIVGSTSTWVDQQLVLSWARVFITHGGMNSVHDAIRHKVPMIVYPLDPNYDQNGNSSRVVHHKLGLRGDLDTETVDGLRTKLIEVVELKKNFEAFDLADKYTIDNFIKMLI